MRVRRVDLVVLLIVLLLAARAALELTEIL
jgi:hypothetical protein